MKRESYEYILELLKDPNLYNVEVDICFEDNEFKCRVQCTDPSSPPEDGYFPELYGYEAYNLKLDRICREYPALISKLVDANIKLHNKTNEDK